MRSVPVMPADPVLWYDADASAGLTGRGWLLSGLVDDPKARVSGWRAKLASVPRLYGLLKNCESLIRELLSACPERRDLVHGDLLHQNVLTGEDDAARVKSTFWRRVRYRVRALRSNSFHSLQNPAPELVLAHYFFHFCRAIKVSQKTRPGYVTLALDCAPDGFPYIHWLRCFLPVSVTLNRSSPANQPRWNSSARLRPMSSAA